MKVLDPLVSSSTLDTVRPALEHVAASPGAGIGLVIGLLGALWSASGYVGAFGRAMNRIYEIDEGRPFWKLRPLMLVITLVAVLLVACVLVMLIVSGPLADSIGERGRPRQPRPSPSWNIAKWPVIVRARRPDRRDALLRDAQREAAEVPLDLGRRRSWRSWSGSSPRSRFAFYVAHFGSYDKTYGSLAGAVVGLLWLWITNVALLFGAELDSELERGRQLQAGIAAESELQLPPRDTRGIRKARKKEAKDIARGRSDPRTGRGGRLDEDASGRHRTTPRPTRGRRRRRRDEEAVAARRRRHRLRAGRSGRA